MRTSAKIAVLAVILVLLAGLLGAGAILRRGISARDEPTWVEAFLVRRMRHYAVPRAARHAANPVPLTDAVLAEARAHFADHCASCHGNDGRGDTAIGRNLYPEAPDMASPATQSLTDGEIFYIIHNGVRLTGMPAWGDGTPEDDLESWKLVHFIRHLPAITPEEIAEMESLNPKTRAEIEEEEQIRRFLEGGETAPPQEHRH